jgi:hypothetical protein
MNGFRLRAGVRDLGVGVKTGPKGQPAGAWS